MATRERGNRGFAGAPWSTRRLPGDDDGPPPPPSPGTPFDGALVSSAVGQIARIAASWPSSYLQATTGPFEPGRQEVLAIIRKVLATLPEGCALTAITNTGIDASPLLDHLRPGVGHTLLTTDLRLDGWIQDPFCPVQIDGVHALVEPAGNKPATLARPAEIIEFHRLTAPRSSDDWFEGGNVLAGDACWFLGIDAARLGVAAPDVVALTSAYQELGKDRQLVLVYSEVAVPSVVSRATASTTNTITCEELHFGNAPGTRQPLFHLDMFMTVALDGDSREVVLVGSPRLAYDGAPGCPKIARPPELPPDGTLDAQLDSVATVIAQQMGREAIRFPMPLYYENHGRFRQWRYLTYANALLQRAVDGTKTVWLPTFASPEWPEFAATDDCLAAIYAELGYEIVRLPDCSALAYSGGGPHCLFNYLERT